MKIYRQKNKQMLHEKNRNYYEKNKEKTRKNMKIYYQENKERIRKKQKMYYKNNKEKRNEYKRKYRLKKKNIQSNNNEGTSSVNQQTGDSVNKGKLPNVCEELGNLSNQEEEEWNNFEDEQNPIEVEEPNKIFEDVIKNKDLNKKIHFFDLNEKPEDEE
ncbi:unnamed protein product [Meloidogyne enterolobii]|uniref:Uncharacterized protein n=1 Tax=Meloidogyne enterolobii TaxID=390850 RepID=A0ACB1A5T3_MELEN